MKKKRLFIGLGLFISSSIVLVISASLMWFDNKTKVVPNQIIGSSSGAYYASGKGSKDDPYVINQPRHLYNLAWLQYLGTYNKDSDDDEKIDEVYFKVEGCTNDAGDYILDMTGWVLPPIGTSENPFVGNFNGNNTIIKNLTISNTFTDYGDAHPYYNADGNEMTSDNFKQPQIIGFFGVIGALDSQTYEYTTNIAVTGAAYTDSNLVYDTYVDNITIQNNTTNQELLAGLLAGYVNAPIIQCGVGYGEFNFATGTQNLSDTNKPSGSTINGVSNYSLIGAYNPDKFSYTGLPGSSGSGDQGDDYGTSIDVYNLYNKLSSSLSSTSNPLAIPSNYAIPIKFDSTKSTTGGSGTTTVTSSGTTITANNATTIAVDNSATNIGYYSGNGLNIHKDKFSSLNFSSVKKATNSPINYADLSDDEKNKIQNYLTKSTATGRQGDNAIELSGSSNFEANQSNYSIAWPTDPKTYPSAYTVIKNAKVGSYSGDLFIPTKGIWVAPTKPGRFEFITSGPGLMKVLLVIRLQRSKPKDYSTGFLNTTYKCNFNNDWSGGMIGLSWFDSSIYYYGLEITQDDIDNGYEFFITSSSNYTTSIQYIHYLDIGTDAGSSGDDTSASPTEIDFVYYDSNTKKLVKITSDKDDDGNYIYTNSEVVFQIGSTASGIVSFNRTTSASVLYYRASNTIEVIGTATNATEKDKESDVPKN